MLILNYFVTRINSGFVEGLNNKIKVIKRRCYRICKITLLSQRIWLALEGFECFVLSTYWEDTPERCYNLTTDQNWFVDHTKYRLFLRYTPKYQNRAHDVGGSNAICHFMRLCVYILSTGELHFLHTNALCTNIHCSVINDNEYMV